MGFLVFILSLALLALLIYVIIFVTGEFADIAERKGYDRRRYWHVAFWLGGIGYLIIIGLPDMNTRTAQKLIASRLSDLNETLKRSGANQPTGNAVSSSVYTTDLPEL